MTDVRLMSRTNRSGCTVPVGWLVECVLLVLLVCAIRDMSTSMARIANEMEHLAKRMIVSEADGHTLHKGHPDKATRD